MAVREWNVAKLEELDDPGALEFRTGEDAWGFRGFLVCWKGEIHAYANVCPHLRHPLNLDPKQFFTADNALLVCSSHGARFDPASGLCVAGPCAGDSLQSLGCRVEGSEIWVQAPESMRDKNGGDE
jgi:nitrite reductase/ring-hydroxylating ferredoxin subunit